MASTGTVLYIHVFTIEMCWIYSTKCVNVIWNTSAMQWITFFISIYCSNDSDDGEDNYSDDAEEDEDETPRSTTSSRASRRRKSHKSKNGKYPIDMTPPDKHLKKAEKKIKRYMKHDRVSIINPTKPPLQTHWIYVVLLLPYSVWRKN